MFELFRAATRKDCAVTQAQVRPVVENCYVSFAKQSGNRAKGAAESTIKNHRVFTLKKLRHTAFKFSMQVGHSRKHRRSARSQSMSPERFVRCSDYLGVIGKAEISVGAKINDRLRLTTITNGGTSVSGGQELWLIQLDCPRANSHPISKTWRGLKRIIGLARKEIAKAEFYRDFSHSQRTLAGFAVRLDFEGIKRISVAKVSPATTLR